MQNVHGKEIDLLRTTVKIPGKRPPRAVATVAPTASPKTNGLTKDRSGLQLGIGNTGKKEMKTGFADFHSCFHTSLHNLNYLPFKCKRNGIYGMILLLAAVK